MTYGLNGDTGDVFSNSLKDFATASICSTL